MKIYAKVDGEAYQFERPEVDSRGFVMGSSAKFCPICMKGWAQITAVANEAMKYHCVRGQLCRGCYEYYSSGPMPGSLLEEPQTNCQTVDWDLLSYLPRELLLREFHLHYEFLVSKQETQQNGNSAMAGRDIVERAAVEAYNAAFSDQYPGNERSERLPGIDHSGDGVATSRS